MRRLWILVILAGVVTLHGLQVISVDQGEPPGSISRSMDLISGLADGGGVTYAAPGSTEVQSVSASKASSPESDSPLNGHGVTQHAWTVCLAVLLAGTAVLGALPLGRKMAASIGSDRSVAPLWPVGACRLPRPPDLAELCLLRI